MGSLANNVIMKAPLVLLTILVLVFASSSGYLGYLYLEEKNKPSVEVEVPLDSFPIRTSNGDFTYSGFEVKWEFKYTYFEDHLHYANLLLGTLRYDNEGRYRPTSPLIIQNHSTLRTPNETYKV
jgi:hypothetical protein